MTKPLNEDNFARALVIAVEVHECVINEDEMGMSINAERLSAVIAHHKLPENPIHLSIFVGLIYRNADCTYERVTSIAHYFYHEFQGEGEGLEELIKEAGGVPERVH